MKFSRFRGRLYWIIDLYSILVTATATNRDYRQHTMADMANKNSVLHFKLCIASVDMTACGKLLKNNFWKTIDFHGTSGKCGDIFWRCCQIH